MRYKLFVFLLFIFLCDAIHAQQKTYCNPINIDYGFTPIPNFSEQGRHRATADPVIVLYKDKYFLFSTNQWGYWWSNDMLNWKFISRKFLKPDANVYDELCAPAVAVLHDTMIVIGSTYTQAFYLWMSTNPTVDDWKPLVDSFKVGAWDPGFLADDDGKLYIYFGSSNTYPTYGQEVDRKTFQPIGERVPLLHLNDSIHGWERFGEYHDNTFLKPFIEGSWMTKYNGKYYLQYGAPGTEFSGYGDGVYVGDKPLGPFAYQAHNPFSFKPGGFATGAGHGATYQDIYGNWWHVSTMIVNVKNNFERRNGIWPAGFDKDGIMYCNTAFGDYPTYLPSNKNEDHIKGNFTGWMLLNYNKPVQVSSTFGNYEPNNAVDENIKTYWCAKTADKGEWIQSDLGNVSTVNAVQINYADQDADILGKSTTIYHQYKLYYSTDGKTWKVLVDKSDNKTDVPHDYVELSTPVQARYIKLENIHMADGKFAISGLRVFGNGNGAKPDTVQHFIALRGESERRNCWLKWQHSNDAYGYVIYTGIEPGKLYTSIMVYNANEYYFSAMEKDKPYYFQIEAINENGESARTQVTKVE
ncbi:MAG TPA: discoidin domain-containing protein [Parafilimonas sp.]|nr:discoidin domain-containing protein [Parafilimonas sp.]